MITVTHTNEDVPRSAQWRVGSSSWEWMGRLLIVGAGDDWVVCDWYMTAPHTGEFWNPDILAVNAQKSYMCSYMSANTGRSANERLNELFLHLKEYINQNWWNLLVKFPDNLS